ncbi:MAG: hypothetical protein GTO62_17110, partial [Planctomycetales bacterium]|nr:hypothetical protein [Planctomycetales bacterium]NIP70955.1 hypothetical protein [Planctomycetales bacterium]
TGKLFWLDLAGGEPFLRKDLVAIMECFQAQVMQVPTNGSFPERILEDVRQMKKRLSAEITISFSIDGLQERHEQIRQAPGNWDEV